MSELPKPGKLSFLRYSMFARELEKPKSTDGAMFGSFALDVLCLCLIAALLASLPAVLLAIVFGLGIWAGTRWPSDRDMYSKLKRKIEAEEAADKEEAQS